MAKRFDDVKLEEWCQRLKKYDGSGLTIAEFCRCPSRVATLLAVDTPIVEHLTNLSVLPETGSRFFAVPVKVRAFGTFSVRTRSGVCESRIP